MVRVNFGIISTGRVNSIQITDYFTSIGIKHPFFGTGDKGAVYWVDEYGTVRCDSQKLLVPKNILLFNSIEEHKNYKSINEIVIW